MCPVKTIEHTRRSGGHATGRVSKRQWLEAALDVMASEGVEAVRIVDLAKRLKISKSGFYWHFRDRPSLLDAIKIFWVSEFTQKIMSDVLARPGPLNDRLQYLVGILRERESS